METRKRYSWLDGIRGKSQRLSYEFVCGFFRDHGCVLLEESYKNARTPMKYRCSCGRESKIVFDSFRRGNRCRRCGAAKNSISQSFSYEFVAEEFEKSGCKLMGHYENSRSLMEYICSCGNYSKISWNNFMRGRRCSKCGVMRRSGKFHYEWRKDRKAVKEEMAFRQRCYKILKHALNAFGIRKKDHTSKLLGYSYKELCDHVKHHKNWKSLKRKKWHLDHIYPLKAFVDYGVSDAKVINALDNLQPLSVFGNISKSDSYCREDFECYLKSKGVSWTLLRKKEAHRK